MLKNLADRPDDLQRSQESMNPGTYPAERWIPENDLVAGDVVSYSENVFGGSFRRPIYLGSRKVVARILRESYGSTGQHTFTLEVIFSSGVDPLQPGDVIRRKGRNIYGGDSRRSLWDDEESRIAISSEKRVRSDLAKKRRRKSDLW